MASVTSTLKSFLQGNLSCALRMQPAGDGIPICGVAGVLGVPHAADSGRGGPDPGRAAARRPAAGRQ